MSKPEKPDKAQDVSRDEFNEMRAELVDLEKTVVRIAESTEILNASVAGLRDSVQHLSERQAHTLGQRDKVSLRNVFAVIGVVIPASGVLAALIMFAIKSDTDRLDSQVSTLIDTVKAVDKKHTDEMVRHRTLEGHPGMQARITGLEKIVRANYLENETQHRWIADVIALQQDFNDRVRNIQDLPQSRYSPLRGIGQGMSGGQP